MKRNGKQGQEERLQNVLIKDRLTASKETLGMLRSDLARLLDDYLDLDKDSLQVSLDAKEEGVYVLRIAAKALRIKS